MLIYQRVEDDHPGIDKIDEYDTERAILIEAITGYRGMNLLINQESIYAGNICQVQIQDTDCIFQNLG